MAFWDKGNRFPYTNNHDANLDYMMTIFENIKNEWHDLYVDLVEWKGTTTLELNTWKTNALAQIEQYETDFRAEIAVWKANTEQDIGVWEQSVLADLGTWRANFETLFATTFSNLTQIKTDAEAARDAAAESADAALESAEQAEASAESVSSALTQIATNTGDISELKTQLTDSNENGLTFRKNVETTFAETVSGSNAVTAGTSLANTNVFIDYLIPAKTAFKLLVSSDGFAEATGLYVFFKKTDGTLVNMGQLTIGTEKAFSPLDYEVKAISLYIGGSSITASGILTMTATVLYDTVDTMQKYTDTFKNGLVVKTNPSENLFTWWIVGVLSGTTGKLVFGNDSIISAGYIPVESGETYTINDPEQISANARNAQWVYEYDTNHNFIKYSALGSVETLTVSNTTKYIRLMSQHVGTQSYVIGDYKNFKTFVYKGNEYKPYVSPVPVASYIGVENLKYSAADGKPSSNLFAGNAFACGGIGYADGKVTKGSSLVTTDLIPTENSVYWMVFNGVSGDAQYMFEYDTNKQFIKYTALSYVAGCVILDSNTKYIRIRTQTNGTSGYVLKEVDWYNKHLVISYEPIIRYQSYLPVTNQHTVSRDFYDTAVDFTGLDYVKKAADEYMDEIELDAYDLVMPIITDVHSDLPYSYDLHNYLSAKGFADVAFNLGDNIPDHYSTKARAIEELRKVMHSEFYNPRKSEVYVLCGNHDYNPVNNNDPDYTINQALYYSISLARTKKGYAGSGKNYGYLDLDAPKIRLIWLDSGDIFDNETGEPLTTGTNTIVQQEQFTWFCNVALDFSDKADRADWAVITLSHDALSALSDTGFATVIKAFMDGTSASGTAYCVGRGTTIPQEYNVDFTSQGGMEYICHLNGHYHDDNATQLGNTGRWQIYIPCDNLTAYYYDNGTRTAYTRTPGTIEEHCIDTVCIDKKTKSIIMKRLGVGSDRTFSY